MPPGYKAQTKRGISEITRNISPVKPDDAPMRAYMADFIAFISGYSKNNPGIQYELIYSDSQANAPAATRQ